MREDLGDHDDYQDQHVRLMNQVGVLDFGRILNSHMSLNKEFEISQINININSEAQPTQFSYETSS